MQLNESPKYETQSFENRINYESIIYIYTHMKYSQLPSNGKVTQTMHVITPISMSLICCFLHIVEDKKIV